MEAIQQKAPLRDGRNVRAIHLFQVDFMVEIRGYFLFTQCDIRGGSSLEVREADWHPVGKIRVGEVNNCNSVLMCRGFTIEKRETDPVSRLCWPSVQQSQLLIRVCYCINKKVVGEVFTVKCAHSANSPWINKTKKQILSADAA